MSSCGIVGWGFEKKMICESTLSHLGLKSGTELTFVNEKNLRHHRAGFSKVKARVSYLKPVKLTSSGTQMSLPLNSLLRLSF